MSDGIIIGIISGVIASAIVTFVLIGIKPKVIISDEMCYDYRNDVYRIKIVNLTHFYLTDLKYSLVHYSRGGDHIAITTEIEPSKNRLEFLRAYSSNDINADYAVRFGFRIPREIMKNENDVLVFSLYAKHSISGTGKFWEKEYKIADLKCGVFETGLSTRIVHEKCGHAHKECIAADGCSFTFENPALRQECSIK